MGITIFGAVITIISIYAFFKNEKLLLYMMVFLSTFTAAALFNIELTTTPIQTFEFTGALWLLREFINFIKTKPKFDKEKIISKIKENKLAMVFMAFIVAIFLGEIYLAVSGLSVDYIDFLGEPQKIKFSMGNLTQPVIISFVFVIMIVLSYKLKTKEEVKELLKVFCYSTIFAIIWGLLQFVTFYFKIPYPAFLFNNNAYAAQCYDQIGNNIKRISSIALEPSTFAINLIGFIPFVLGTFLILGGKLKENIKNKKYIITFILLVISTVCAILTTSSTTYVGILVIYGLFGLYILFGFIKKGKLDNRKSNFMKMLIVTITSIVMTCGLWAVSLKIGYATGAIDYIVKEKPTEKPDGNKDKDKEEVNSIFDNIAKTVKQMTIDKLASGSGKDRLNGEGIGLSMIKHSPVFGLGFGSYRTFSMFTNIFVNTGVIGTLIYLTSLGIVIKAIWKYRKKDEPVSIMFLISIIGMTAGFWVGVPDLVLTYYWMIMVFGYKYATLEK
ncbi:MAG: hypothetical protein HFJ24_03295 [Clostridia bacterium]|nr:hypothetical protein [Clostridia bacterium]